MEFDRSDAPNLQGLPFLSSGPSVGDFASFSVTQNGMVEEKEIEGQLLTVDSVLPPRDDPMSPYDKLLLWVFRKSVESETGMDGRWGEEGIEGLVKQGREFMITCNQEEGDPGGRQSEMVKKVLGGLMGPIKPIYRLFMAGIVPVKAAEFLKIPDWGDKQVFKGGVIYAPYLTSLVTPLFFQFLVGPAKTNRRRDGERGGVLVEKCRFLEKSNCKGLCLHQCKNPAETFFRDELGVDLYVQPNFVTQECQWSWGEETKDLKTDEEWPKGCLEGCIDRKKQRS